MPTVPIMFMPTVLTVPTLTTTTRAPANDHPSPNDYPSRRRNAGETHELSMNKRVGATTRREAHEQGGTEVVSLR